MSWFKKAWNSVKKATKSPIFHAVEGGLALAFPEVAITANAALTMGNKALSMANSANAEVREKYRAVVRNTEALAKEGHPAAQRAVAAMQLAKDAKAGKPEALAEVKRIRDAAAAQRARALAVVKMHVVDRRTGIVQLRPQYRNRRR